eukprot:5489636-Prymnesium_polylepis.1
MVVGKRRGAICGRGRQRKRTPFAGRNVGLHEPVTLVQVPSVASVPSAEGLDVRDFILRDCEACPPAATCPHPPKSAI